MNFENTVIYLYKGNPNSTYLKNNGSWLICNEKTDGYIEINDPEGKRKAVLDDDAYAATKYRYPKNDSVYVKNSNGDWFISNDKTNGFVKIVDPTGERTRNLNADAIKIS
jgi:hypothetical protein